jgi:hypothetical protein
MRRVDKGGNQGSRNRNGSAESKRPAHEITYDGGFEGLFVLTQFTSPITNRGRVHNGTNGARVCPEVTFLTLQNFAQWALL